MPASPQSGGPLAGARSLVEQAQEIWIAGGWAMIGIAAIALVMFGVGMRIHLRLREKGFLTLPEDTWRRWIRRPEERRGPIGELLDFAASGASLKETSQLFARALPGETAPFQRDLRVMRTCVTAAPLVGLLGTVTGMLTTFDALAGGSGGEKTMSLIASGISEALITTETGLVIALPGLFFQYLLARLHERHEAFLAHVETVCTQHVHRGERARAAANARETSGRAEITPSPRTAKVARVGAPLPEPTLNR
jgi:biopolymer transport protein ExbB